MISSHCPAVDVDLVDVEAQFLNAVRVHGAESLVDLVQVNVVLCQPGMAQQSSLSSAEPP
jgi:hypothetical protein